MAARSSSTTRPTTSSPRRDLEAAVGAAYGLQRAAYALAALRDGAAPCRCRRTSTSSARTSPCAPATRRTSSAGARGAAARGDRRPLRGSLPGQRAPYAGLCATCPGRGGLCSHPRRCRRSRIRESPGGRATGADPVTPSRLRWPARRLAGVLELGVELGAEQERGRHQVQPQQQHDGAGERAVDGAVVAEVAQVEPERGASTCTHRTTTSARPGVSSRARRTSVEGAKRNTSATASDAASSKSGQRSDGPHVFGVRPQADLT